MKNTYVLIMAGGVGSRFWPKSRNHFPKQFIDILGIGKSLLQLTYDRFLSICPVENIYILTNGEYASLIAEQLPQISKSNIISEPSRNNTAPCIAYASFKILDLNPDANIVVAPSDHLILKEGIFLNKIKEALAYTSEHDALLTLGISPSRPDTGYEYINCNQLSVNGIHKVKAFLEKPDLEKAKKFVSDGNYLWNAGIFIWSASSILASLKLHVPEVYSLFETGKAAYNTIMESDFIAENYSLAPNISIDYAVMEKAENVYTIPCEFGWSDLGTWASLYEVLDKDENNNVFHGHNVSMEDTTNCMIQLPKEKVAVIKGLQNYIVVDDGKVLLIYPKENEQEIKEVSKNIVALCGSSFS
jgi:mannose-1-phosphate guanylyltransferase